jgi:hypothetical protein
MQRLSALQKSNLKNSFLVIFNFGCRENTAKSPQIKRITVGQAGNPDIKTGSPLHKRQQRDGRYSKSTCDDLKYAKDNQRDSDQITNCTRYDMMWLTLVQKKKLWVISTRTLKIFITRHHLVI